MKQVLITLLLFVAVMTAGAQNDKGAAINEKFFQAKVNELVQRLEMTDEQRAKFEPVYRRYNNEMRALWEKGRRHSKAEDSKNSDVKRSEACKKEPLTDEQKLERTKRRMERQQQAQTIRLKYIDEFATVLTAQQVNRFYEVEGQIQKKLMERRRHHHGGKHPHSPDKK